MRRLRRDRESRAESGSIGVLYSYSPGVPIEPPLHRELAVFARPRRPSDELPDALAEHFRAFDQFRLSSTGEEDTALDLPRPRLPIFRRARQARLKRAMQELEELARDVEEQGGSHVVADSRLLLNRLGRDDLRLYAVPTTTGEVSYYIAGAGGDVVSGSGTPALSEGVAWHISYERGPGRTYVAVFGLVANDVAGVEIELKKSRRLAVAGDNGFFYEGTDHEPEDVSAVVLHTTSAASRRVAIG